MSASLVGSEMCIRDSEHAPLPGPSRNGLPHRANGGSSLSHLGKARPTSCLLYTSDAADDM
eukprot:4401465-Alexandrium_andersonii.AAC.1